MFSIHPRELQVRRKKCGPVIDVLTKAARQPHTRCNICGCLASVLLATSDRYGLPVRTVMCRNCGLIFLVDRLHPDTYSEFYQDGTYRDLTTRFNGRQRRLQSIQQDQRQYAARVIDSLESFSAFPEHRSLLDVGGSAGLVAAAVSSRFGCAATVLDPAVEEVAAAEAIGLEGVVGSIETYCTERRFDIILLCRSIEHLFDLHSSLLKIRELLKPHGILYCDIVEFVESCRSIGAPEAVTKLDHCYWLCQETAPVIFGALGFEVISADVSSQSETIGYLLRRCESARAARTPQFVLHSMVRRLREISSDWRCYGEMPLGVKDRLRRIAYRAKRRISCALFPEKSPGSLCQIPAKERSGAPAAASRTADPPGKLAFSSGIPQNHS